MGRLFWVRLVVGSLFAVVLGLFAAAFFFRDRDLYSRQVGVLFSQGLKESLRGELVYRSFHGNPLLGYRGGDLVLRNREGVGVLEVRELRAFLDWGSLLSGSPRLSRVDLIGVSGDLEGLRSLVPPRDPQAPPLDLPVERTILREARLTTPWGPVSVDRGSLRAERREYRFRAEGSWEGRPAEVRGRYVDEPPRELELRVLLEGQELEVEGTLGDRADLAGRVEDFDLKELERFLPDVKPSKLRGRVATRFEIHGPLKNLAAEGEGTWESGGVAGLALEDVAGSWSYGDGQLAFRVSKGKVFGTPLEGTVDLDFRRDLRLGLRLRGEGLDPKAWKGYFSWLEGVEGPLRSVSLDLKGPVERLEGPVTVQAPRVTLWGEELTDLRASARLRGSAPLSLRASGLWQRAPFDGKGEVDPRTASVKLQGAFRSLDLSRLAVRFPDLKPLGAQGAVSGSLEIAGPAKRLVFTVRTAPADLSILWGESREPLGRVGTHLDLSGGVLRLRSFSGQIRGARVRGSGELLGLGSSGTTLALAGRVEGVDLSRWKDRLPVDRFGVQGALSGSFRVSGPSNRPSIRVDAASPQLRTRDLAPLKEVRLLGVWEPGGWRVDRLSLRLPGGDLSLSGKGSRSAKGMGPFSLSGPFSGFTTRWLARPEVLPFRGTLGGVLTVRGDGNRVLGEATLRAPRVVWKELEVERLSGKVGLDGRRITLTRLGGALLEGSGYLDGTVLLPEQAGDPLVDLKGTVADLRVGGWAAQHLGDLRLTGLLDGTFRVKGPEKDLKVEAQGSLDRPVVQGLAFSALTFRLTGEKDRLELQEVKAHLGGGSATGRGTLRDTGTGWALEFSVAGDDLDLSQLGRAFPASLRRSVAGRVGFRFQGKGTPQGLTGQGEVVFPELRFLGFRGTEIRAPLFVTEGFVTVEEATGKSYGGTLKGQIARDLNSSRYGGHLEIRGADVAAALKDGFPSMKGSVTGKGDFVLRLQGDVSRTSLQDGEGRFSLTDGEISGFEGAKAVAAVTGGKPIRFRSLAGSFNVDGKSLFLLPGSRISAPPGDGAYRYLMADGSLDDKGRLDVACLGNVNIRALNVAVGVLQGLVQSGLDGGGLLENFLGGAVGGFARKDFRDVSFRIRGTLENPKISELKVARNQKTLSIPETGGSKNRTRPEDGVRIRIEVPLGEGLASDDNLGSQLQEQLLQNAVRLILRPGEQY